MEWNLFHHISFHFIHFYYIQTMKSSFVPSSSNPFHPLLPIQALTKKRWLFRESLHNNRAKKLILHQYLKKKGLNWDMHFECGRHQAKLSAIWLWAMNRCSHYARVKHFLKGTSVVYLVDRGTGVLQINWNSANDYIELTGKEKKNKNIKWKLTSEPKMDLVFENWKMN